MKKLTASIPVNRPRFCDALKHDLVEHFVVYKSGKPDGRAAVLIYFPLSSGAYLASSVFL